MNRFFFHPWIPKIGVDTGIIARQCVPELSILITAVLQIRA